jgi:asparagine synthase (glutamine-hydrolysing)
MCGIAGLIDRGDLDALQRMIDVQRHRGPDDQGIWSRQLSPHSWVGLGSARLSILDLSPAGHMPMSTPDGTLTVVYNGEIYNSPQLRAELESKGCQFQSRTDTEVVLWLYATEGVSCVRRLNGMFAFAIWDQRKRHLFVARDHFGIKPLYYCHQGRGFAFASEAKALLQVRDVPRRVNLTALHQYLTFLWVPDPLTLFEGILKLRAGHYAVLKGEELTIQQYWDLKYPPAGLPTQLSESEIAHQLRERFQRTVQAQMLSDVPVGAFLSAGIDSSSIVAAMAQSSTRPVRTYTIGFADKYRKGELTLDDTAVAARTAQRFGCHHSQIIVEPNVVELLPKLIWHMDEPIADPAIVAAFLVSREARKDVTVLLSGVGGDELFGGYRKYRAHYLAAHYQRIPGCIRRRLIEPLAAALPSCRGTALKGYVRLFKKMVRSGSLPPQSRFLTDSVYLSGRQKEQLYSDELYGQVQNQPPWAEHLAHFASPAEADFLNQMLYVDIKTFMVSLNLTYNDKMSMAASVEARVPFLDWELAEWVAWNVPPELKVRGRTTKYMLRRAMKPILPGEVLSQKKAGFGAPVDHWLRHDLSEMLEDLLGEQRIKSRGFFKSGAVRRLISEHQSGREDWSLQLWQLLTLELWMQTFLDAKN